MILTKMMPVKIAQIAVHHKNDVVRASAFRCLLEMAKVDEFLTAILTYSNFYVSDLIFNIISSHIIKNYTPFMKT